MFDSYMIGGRESLYSFESLLLDFCVSLQEATIGPLLITSLRQAFFLKAPKGNLAHNSESKC
jgi:hypothetical protein